MTGIGLWPTLSFRDADAMIAWLEAIGFTDPHVYRDEQDPSVVVHAEMRWPGGGGIMFGSHREGNDVVSPPGHSAAYLVTDDPDKVVHRGGRGRRHRTPGDGRPGLRRPRRQRRRPGGQRLVVRRLPAPTEMGRAPAPRPPR